MVIWRSLVAAGIGRPKGTVLWMIAWYQTNVSARRNVCERPAGYNCSAFAVWAINTYWLVFGLVFSALRMTQPCLIEHRGKRDDYWWSKCIMIGLFGLVTHGACSDGPGDRRDYG